MCRAHAYLLILPCVRGKPRAGDPRRLLALLALLDRFVQRLLQHFALHISNPLLDHVAFSIKQEEMWLVLIPQLSFECGRLGIIDIQIDEIDLIPPFLLEPVHDGRQ